MKNFPAYQLRIQLRDSADLCDDLGFIKSMAQNLEEQITGIVEEI